MPYLSTALSAAVGASVAYYIIARSTSTSLAVAKP
jgi:hypothetical protein